MSARLALLAILLTALAPGCAGKTRSDTDTHSASLEPSPPEPTLMTSNDACTQLRDALAERRFADFRGLNAQCAPAALFPGWSDDPERFRVRPLGRNQVKVRTTPIELAGYLRPEVSVRDGSLVLFDAKGPELDSAALLSALGEPELKLDAHFGTLPLPQGEYVYPSRGLALWVSHGKIVHLAAFVPTSAEDYRATLSPDLEKKMRF